MSEVQETTIPDQTLTFTGGEVIRAGQSIDLALEVLGPTPDGSAESAREKLSARYAEQGQPAVDDETVEESTFTFSIREVNSIAAAAVLSASLLGAEPIVEGLLSKLGELVQTLDEQYGREALLASAGIEE